MRREAAFGSSFPEQASRARNKQLLELLPRVPPEGQLHRASCGTQQEGCGSLASRVLQPKDSGQAAVPGIGCAWHLAGKVMFCGAKRSH